MLVDTQYMTNSKRLVISYVDKSGDIKLKYYEWDNPQKYVACDDDDRINIQHINLGMVKVLS